MPPIAGRCSQYQFFLSFVNKTIKCATLNSTTNVKPISFNDLLLGNPQNPPLNTPVVSRSLNIHCCIFVISYINYWLVWNQSAKAKITFMDSLVTMISKSNIETKILKTILYYITDTINIHFTVSSISIAKRQVILFQFVYSHNYNPSLSLGLISPLPPS